MSKDFKYILLTQTPKETLKFVMAQGANQPPDEDHSGGTAAGTLTRVKPKVKKPKMYKVVLLNDDFTPMDFVIHILKKFFNKSATDANKIMMEVHQQGSGVAGVFSHEIAETKTYLVNEYSKQNEHPLKCVMEETD